MIERQAIRKRMPAPDLEERTLALFSRKLERLD
jgi:hypothetical protein